MTYSFVCHMFIVIYCPHYTYHSNHVFHYNQVSPRKHISGNCVQPWRSSGLRKLLIWYFWALSQYPKRRLIVRSREVSKSRILYLELSDRSEIWQALRQHCCRCACQISKRYDNLKYQSPGFETSRDLTIRRLFGYWDGALDATWCPSGPFSTTPLCV